MCIRDRYRIAEINCRWKLGYCKITFLTYWVRFFFCISILWYLWWYTMMYSKGMVFWLCVVRYIVENMGGILCRKCTRFSTSFQIRFYSSCKSELYRGQDLIILGPVDKTRSLYLTMAMSERVILAISFWGRLKRTLQACMIWMRAIENWRASLLSWTTSVGSLVSGSGSMVDTINVFIVSF